MTNSKVYLLMYNVIIISTPSQLGLTFHNE